MNTPIIRKDVVGQEFDFEFTTDVSSINEFKFYLKLPDGTEKEYLGNTVQKGLKYALRYSSGPGDLSQQGEYNLQLYIKTTSFEGRRENIRFYVCDYFTV